MTRRQVNTKLEQKEKQEIKLIKDNWTEVHMTRIEDNVSQTELIYCESLKT